MLNPFVFQSVPFQLISVNIKDGAFYSTFCSIFGGVKCSIFFILKTLSLFQFLNAVILIPINLFRYFNMLSPYIKKELKNSISLNSKEISFLENLLSDCYPSKEVYSLGKSSELTYINRDKYKEKTSLSSCTISRRLTKFSTLGFISLEKGTYHDLIRNRDIGNSTFVIAHNIEKALEHLKQDNNQSPILKKVQLPINLSAVVSSKARTIMGQAQNTNNKESNRGYKRNKSNLLAIEEITHLKSIIKTLSDFRKPPFKVIKLLCEYVETMQQEVPYD